MEKEASVRKKRSIDMDDVMAISNSNEEEKSPVNEVLTRLKKIFPCEKFIVTGGQALKVYGLVEKADDIDIILIKPTEFTEQTLELYQEQFPAKTKPHTKYSGELGLKSIFMFYGWKVDVFIINEDDSTLKIKEFNYATITSIIQAKKGYNRMKDWVQLRKMGRVFFKEEEFINYLNK